MNVIQQAAALQALGPPSPVTYPVTPPEVLILSGPAMAFRDLLAKQAQDFHYDLRALPNPYSVPTLKDLTGLDSQVQAWLLGQAKVAKALPEIITEVSELALERRATANSMIPVGEAKVIAHFYCKGGVHRSPAFGYLVGRRLGQMGLDVEFRLVRIFDVTKPIGTGMAAQHDATQFVARWVPGIPRSAPAAGGGAQPWV